MAQLPVQSLWQLQGLKFSGSSELRFLEVERNSYPDLEGQDPSVNIWKFEENNNFFISQRKLLIVITSVKSQTDNSSRILLLTTALLRLVPCICFNCNYILNLKQPFKTS